MPWGPSGSPWGQSSSAGSVGSETRASTIIAQIMDDNWSTGNVSPKPVIGVIYDRKRVDLDASAQTTIFAYDIESPEEMPVDIGYNHYNREAHVRVEIRLVADNDALGNARLQAVWSEARRVLLNNRSMSLIPSLQALLPPNGAHYLKIGQKRDQSNRSVKLYVVQFDVTIVSRFATIG